MTVSAAESPTSPDISPPEDGGVRASDAERDEAAGELGEHFAAGRLSHDTFVYRMNAVMRARRQSDLPPLLADLPPRKPSPGARARQWLAGGWTSVREEAGAVARSALAGLRITSAGFPAVPGPPPVPVPVRRPAPAPLAFPRGAGTLFTIGRDPECDLAIADLTVSRAHAVLERTAGGWLLTDTASTNGTRVNGWRVRDTVPVRAGDVVRFGDAEYTLTALGDQ